MLVPFYCTSYVIDGKIASSDGINRVLNCIQVSQNSASSDGINRILNCTQGSQNSLS